MEEEDIGIASMDSNGTIVLVLRAVGSCDMIGDGRLIYTPSHPRYEEVLRHLGGMQAGESKPVRPWSTPEG